MKQNSVVSFQFFLFSYCVIILHFKSIFFVKSKSCQVYIHGHMAIDFLCGNELQYVASVGSG